MYKKVAPMPERPLKAPVITPMERLGPKFTRTVRRLTESQLAGLRQLVGLLLECEIEPQLLDCDADEFPVAREHLMRRRFHEASHIALCLVLPQARQYSRKWGALVQAAKHDAYAHALVVLMAQELTHHDAVTKYVAPDSEYKDTRYPHGEGRYVQEIGCLAEEYSPNDED